MKWKAGLSPIFVLSIFFSASFILLPLIGSGQVDSTSSKVVFFEDFRNNNNNWTLGRNRHENTRMDSGYYYLTAVGHAYGEAQAVKIDTKKNFEIEARIKIVAGNPTHKDYYNMLFWGREKMQSYYFTFAKDGFVSVEQCTSKNQRNCVTQTGSLQKTTLAPDGFNIYTVRKKGTIYSFYVNGTKFYEMPFSPFFGDLIGFGAGRNVSLAIDYLKVSYL